MSGERSAAGAIDDGACFACGPHNADGLGLTFRREPDGVAQATCRLPARFQGYRGIAHGGIVMLLLDEAMAHACGGAGEAVMTAEASVRFRAPVPLERTLTLSGRVVSRRGKILRVEAAVRDAAGTTLATAQGSFVSLGPLAGVTPGNRAGSAAV